MVLESTETKGAEIKTPLKAILSKSEPAIRGMLKRLDDLISWSRMKFKEKKPICTFKKGKQKEVGAADPIPTVKEESVKSLGRLNYGNLSDKSQ